MGITGQHQRGSVSIGDDVGITDARFEEVCHDLLSEMWWPCDGAEVVDASHEVFVSEATDATCGGIDLGILPRPIIGDSDGASRLTC